MREIFQSYRKVYLNDLFKSLTPFILSFFLLILARSNYDHYARECDFGILKKKTKTKQKKTKKSFGCVFN